MLSVASWVMRDRCNQSLVGTLAERSRYSSNRDSASLPNSAPIATSLGPESRFECTLNTYRKGTGNGDNTI